MACYFSLKDLGYPTQLTNFTGFYHLKLPSHHSSHSLWDLKIHLSWLLVLSMKLQWFGIRGARIIITIQLYAITIIVTLGSQLKVMFHPQILQLKQKSRLNSFHRRWNYFLFFRLRHLSTHNLSKKNPYCLFSSCFTIYKVKLYHRVDLVYFYLYDEGKYNRSLSSSSSYTSFCFLLFISSDCNK